MALQKVGPYEVDPNNPWENDKLGRKRVASYLTPVIASITQPFTISLHSPYGTGKTSFIQSWQVDLRREGYKTVYFNAWETDFSQDAFLAFMAAVRDQLGKQSSASARVGDKLTNVAKRGVWTLTKRIVPAIAKGAVKKALGDEAFEEMLDAIAVDGEKVSDVAGELVAVGLEAQLAAEKSRGEFKGELGEIVSSLFLDEADIGKRKVIVFVDDLDRCRPTYAIAVLEAIKHLFEVKGLLFVLSIDEAQIQESVRAVYGHGANADGYLAKFIDWRYRLPKIEQNKYIDFILEKYAISEAREYHDNDLQSFESMAHALRVGAVSFNWTLRECNAVIANINLVCRAVKPEAIFFARMIGLTAVLSYQFPKEFQEALLSKDPDLIVSAIQKHPDAINQLRFGPWHRCRDEIEFLFAYLDKEYFNKKLKIYNDALEQATYTPQRVDKAERKRAATLKYLHEHVERLFDGRFFNLTIERSLAGFSFSDISGAAEITSVLIRQPDHPGAG